MPLPTTIGELRETGARERTVKQEMRQNLIAKLRRHESVFPGIVGYDDSVIPQIESAVLSGHDLVLLGERGQAKTRIARALVNLLDEFTPIVAGCEINDDPFHPICQVCRQRIDAQGDDTEIAWLPRDRRYGEKLATPDITIADLIGEVDPIKVAEGRYLSDELTIHYGLIPRTHRGIFCINELPDLGERIQVGLLNIMEERDVQIRGYKVRLPLDLYVVVSANPEDYTNRGRIITPLKDRFGSQVRTHYPRTIEHEIDVMEQEQTAFHDDEFRVFVPDYMKQIVAEITHLARKSPDISQRSGVSARVSICNYETLVASATRRSIALNEELVVPRVSDLASLVPSTQGKIELETVGDAKEDRVVEKLMQGAVLNVFNRNFSVSDFEPLLGRFERGHSVEVGEGLGSERYLRVIADMPELRGAVVKLTTEPSAAAAASAVEFILEGLHLNRKLNKDRQQGKSRYRR
jgi:magnesium chelatase subunit I